MREIDQKLCNHMQKPTGKPGVLQDRIFQCIDIECRMQAEANAAILGVDLAKSSHSRDGGSSNYSSVIEEEGVGANDAADASKDGPPFASIEFSDGGGDKAGEEDEEVVAANIAVNVVISGESAEGAAGCILIHSCCLHLVATGCPMQQPQLFCLLVAGGELAEICNQNREGVHHQCPTPVGREQRKDKKSTNHKWGSISKAMDSMAQ